MTEAIGSGLSGADLTPGSELSHDYLELAFWVRRVAPVTSAVLLPGRMERTMRQACSPVEAPWNWFQACGQACARLLLYAYSLLFLAVNCITVDFKWPEQLVLGILTIALAFAIHRIADTELITFCLMFASMLATARYAYWRCSSVFDAAVDPGLRVGKVDLAFMLVLYRLRSMRSLSYISVTFKPSAHCAGPLPPCHLI